jgi:hypothetical protein
MNRKEFDDNYSKIKTHQEIIPVESVFRDAMDVFHFFMYYTVDSSSLKSKYKISKLKPEERKSLLAKMMDVSFKKGSDLLFIREDFDISAIIKMKLADDLFLADRVKGFLMLRKVKNGYQQELGGLLTCVRNSLAHGMIAIHDEFLILESITEKKYEKEECKQNSNESKIGRCKIVSARIVLTIAILKAWKEIIEDFANSKSNGDN